MTTFDDAKKLLEEFPRKKGGHYNWREHPGKTARLVQLVMEAPNPRAFAQQLGAVLLYQAFAAGMTADGTEEWPELRIELKHRGVALREIDREKGEAARARNAQRRAAKSAPAEQAKPSAPDPRPAPEPAWACPHCGTAAKWREGLGSWICTSPRCGRSTSALRVLAVSILGVPGEAVKEAPDAALAAEATAAVRNLERLAGVAEGSPVEVARRLQPPPVRRDVRADGADLIVSDTAVLAYGTPAHRLALAGLLRGIQIREHAAPAAPEPRASEPATAG